MIEVTSQTRKNGLFNKCCWDNWGKKLNLYFILHQIKIQNESELNVKNETPKILKKHMGNQKIKQKTQSGEAFSNYEIQKP